MMKKSTKITFIVMTSLIKLGSPFAPQFYSRTNDSSLNMAKRKVSMSEKRKIRQAKQRGESQKSIFANLPKAKLDIQQSAVSATLDTPEKISDPVVAAQKAKELLKAQRESVNMLTAVKEKIERLSSEDIVTALDDKGYFIVDGLLNDDVTLETMENEAKTLYSDGALEVDVGNLGSGEYAVAIKGGGQQYVKCPRTVEWVVATTKHFPELLPSLSLDASACMATLKMFDRKAFQASLKLLTGSDQLPETTMPFTVIVPNKDIDKRRLTLQYFMVPSSWDETHGGGVTFESSKSATAKRDRLVVWKSDSCSLRKELWKGTDELPLASYLELHLVEKAS